VDDHVERDGRLLVDKAENGRWRWRLKATNGRIVATSWPAYADADEAGLAFGRLRKESEGLPARISHVKDGAGWIWVLQSPQGTPLARSMRSYERYATCQIAFGKFMALLESAG
jgi:uncharacterized protein YegP (UPF0339 family)